MIIFYSYKIFVDSKLEGQQVISGAVPSDRSARTVYIGNIPGLQPATFFNGYMKEMRYYRSAYYIQFAAKGKEIFSLGLTFIDPVHVQSFVFFKHARS
jgi:hypothetical protein